MGKAIWANWARAAIQKYNRRIFVRASKDKTIIIIKLLFIQTQTVNNTPSLRWFSTNEKSIMHAALKRLRCYKTTDTSVMRNVCGITPSISMTTIEPLYFASKTWLLLNVSHSMVAHRYELQFA